MALNDMSLPPLPFSPPLFLPKQTRDKERIQVKHKFPKVVKNKNIFNENKKLFKYLLSSYILANSLR